MQVQYKFADKEIKQLLSENLVVVCDSREQMNLHILDYFDKQKIKYVIKKLDAGDYSVKLTANIELGLQRDIYLPIMIEKKNSCDELASSIKDRTRFEAEFIKAMGAGTKIHLLVEEADGYANILKGNYLSQYEPKAFLASLKTFEARYNFTTVFQDKLYSGNYIYHTLKYYLYEFLKS